MKRSNRHTTCKLPLDPRPETPGGREQETKKGIPMNKHRSARWFLAVVACLLTAVSASAQFAPSNSPSGFPQTTNPGPYAIVRESYYPADTIVRREPIGDSRPGIFLTSINYPGVYGSF